ncbi:hypothetical protein [Vibrio sonorensis]|uniref:hypothetical protein n=1 Tax=Vibrio sonorensis TaxID=1004316 RepID=UPI0008D975BD|nr:hypothetical protein [Vibrio sonorensis]
MPVLLSNYTGKTGGWDAAGRSGVWLPSGISRETELRSNQGIAFYTFTDKQLTNEAFIEFK